MAVNFSQAIFGNTPDLPPLKTIDLGDEQLKAIQANKNALPAIEDVATRVNQFNQDALLKNLRSVFPHVDELLSQTGENLLDWSKGKLGQGVEDAVHNFAASRNLEQTGIPLFDSGLGRDRVARDISETSYKIAKDALTSTKSWIATARQALTAPTLDFTSAFISPATQAQFDVNERNTMWNYDWFKEQADAQPAPWEKAVGGLIDWIGNTALSVGSLEIGHALQESWKPGDAADPNANAPGSGKGGSGFYGGGSSWG